MASIDYFCDRMRYWCDEGNLGYDQYQRWNIYEGGECDCSSLVIFALQEAGFDTGGATYTGNMSSNLTARGWVRLYPDGNPQRGDILLSDANHVAVWLGDCLAQASIDENGNIAGGQAGDQSGWETNTRSYYSYPWDCYLRFTGGSEPVYDGDTGDGVVYEVHTSDGWLGPVSRCDDTEDGYAGYRSKAIDGIRAYRTDGQPLTIAAIMDDGNEWDPTTFRGSMWGENAWGDGYAGNINSGSVIIGLRVYGAKCRVKAWNGGWLGWTEGDNPTPEGDDFAGEDLPKKVPITAVQMKL